MNIDDMNAEFEEMLVGQMAKRQAMAPFDLNSVALDAATAIVAIPAAAELVGGECQRKAMIQCAVRDAIERYKARS